MAEEEIAWDAPAPKEEIAWDKPVAAAPPAPGAAQQRQHAYRTAIHAGSPELPAGAAAPVKPQPELRHDFGQTAKGIAKGVPAAVAGGVLGDVEEMGRRGINWAAGKQAVSPHTAIPTTVEGGWIGERGAGILPPPTSEDEKGGMTIGSMFAGPPLSGLYKGARAGVRAIKARMPELPPPPPPAPPRQAPPGAETVDLMTAKPPVAPEASALPTTPPGSPAAVPREGTGARLLPADVPHVETAGTLEDTLAGRRSAGAAGGSPLEEFNPETIAHMRKTLEQEGVTPWTLEQRLEEMSPHQSLAEFSPNTEAHAGATAAPPGAGKNEVINFFAQRGKEAKERMRSTFDQAFGPAEDLAQQNRVLNIDQSAEAGPLYDRFRSMEIPPTPALDALVPRLQSVGAFGEARAKALAEGRAWQQEWFTPEQRSAPTAQSWDYVKRALDQKIGGSYDPVSGRATDWTRIYTRLKNDLMSAIAHHPDEEIANVWREARRAWAGPEEVKNAQRLGRKLLTKAVDADEFRFETAGFGEHQIQGLRQGLRKDLENSLGNAGKTELPVMKQILGENNQEKLRWVIGDQPTDALVRSIEHEFNMHGASTRIHGNSPTALRQEANKFWTPQPGLFSASDLASALHGLTGAAAHAAKKTFLARHAAKQEAKFARLRDEAARIYTMQGPERDAVLRYLLSPEAPRAKGGRVIERAAGGRVAHSNINHNPTEAQKEAGNYAKDHVSIHGLDITVENAKGKSRRGIGKDGKPWAVKMPAHYGYIKRTQGADGDQVDCYIGPHIKSNRVYIVDQKDADAGHFDEHKCMLGFASKKQAEATYKRGFSDGRGQERIGRVSEMSIDQFKSWLSSGDTTAPIKRADGGRTPKVDYQATDLGRTSKHEINASYPLISNVDLTARAHTYSNEPYREKPSDWGASIGLRRNFAEGGLTDWVDRGDAGDAEEARNVAARRVARSVLHPNEDISMPEEPRSSIPREIVGHLGPDYREGVTSMQAGAADMSRRGIENMKSGNPFGLLQGALAPALGVAAPIGGAMNAMTKGLGRIGPGVEHAADVATWLNPDTPLLKAAPMIAGAAPVAKATAKANVVKTAEKLAQPAEAAAVHEAPKPVREFGNEGRQADEVAAATEAAPEASVRGSEGAGSVAGAQAAATRAAGTARPLEGLPTKPLTINTPEGEHVFVPGPIERVHQIAEDYMRDAGMKYQPITSYREVSVPRAKRIAAAYEKMPHAPEDPAVKASYNALIDETVAQLKALQKSGLDIEFIKPGMKDPYEASPRLAQIDVRDNNHLWVFPTDAGFGSTGSATAAELANNPLLRKTGVTIGDRELLANDAFRIVHDFFGHLKDGVGFRAGGEENAWRSHSRMYSKLARPAMTSETRGQNSWLNYGPHGEKNRTAKSADTIYADQKTGIMPSWTHTDGVQDYYVAPEMRDARGHESVNAGVDALPNKSAQTVADPHRMMYPGIYENPRRIAQEAAERVAPEDINMKRLWGVSRGDLDEMVKGRKGNRDPDVYQGPGRARGALSAQNIQTPQNTQRLQDILTEAGKYPGLKHADAWYILDPVYQHMAKLFGPEEAKVRFERLNTLMGMASPGSEVMSEIQRGTAANMKVEQGKFDEFLKYAGTPREWRKGPEDLRRVEAHPYHRTSQAEPMQKYLETGKIQSKEAKVPAYVQASGAPETGFQTRGPVVDSHFSRGVGLSDTRKGPSDVAGSASRPEYHTLQPWWEKEVAGEMGLESVPAQARLWTALGPRTGVSSQLGQGKLELLTKQIMVAARRLGITPEQARDLILSGKAHAGMLAGTVGVGAAGVASGVGGNHD